MPWTGSKEEGDKLAAVGRAVFGDHWQAPMARHFEIDERTVRSWLSGRRLPVAGFWIELDKLAVQRQAELVSARDGISSNVKSAAEAGEEWQAHEQRYRTTGDRARD